MKPVIINGDVWNVIFVKPGDPMLIDRTGKARVATTDSLSKVIRLDASLSNTPPLLDKVLLHEMAHAITVSHGLLTPLRYSIPEDMWVPVEEWSANLMERHAIEAAVLTSQALGRPLCINGYCIMTKTN